MFLLNKVIANMFSMSIYSFTIHYFNIMCVEN